VLLDASELLALDRRVSAAQRQACVETINAIRDRLATDDGLVY
jgi:hypothetical protein